MSRFSSRLRFHLVSRPVAFLLLGFIVGPAASRGQVPPDDAMEISKDEYRVLRETGNWFGLRPRGDEKAEAKAIAQDRKDLAKIMAYARKNGLALSDLLPPDPSEDDRTVLPTDDGNFLHSADLNSGGTTEVVTFGRRWFLRTVAKNIEVFPGRENQGKNYRALYEGLPEVWRRNLSLPPPEDLSRASSAQLLELNRALADPDTATSIIQDLQPPEPPPIPPAFLDQCALETGAGAGSDRDGSGTISPDGIVANHSWALKPYITCVKAQGNRGSCTGFANTSAIEILVGKTHGPRVNLSEQGYYNRARTAWDNPANFGDGHTSIIGFQGMQEEGFLLYFENQWNYNPSPSRTANKATQTYSDSCVGYSETCSNTVHQSQAVCVSTPFGKQICGYFVPNKNPNNQGYRIGDSVALWDETNPNASLFWMILHLAMGHPLVLGAPIINAWDEAFDDGWMPYPSFLICTGPQLCPDAPGPLPICDCHVPRGGHGSSIVGYIFNDDLQSLLPNAPPGLGGGYFIVKNSWGNEWGDGGFIYVPFQFVVDSAGDVTALLEVQ